MKQTFHQIIGLSLTKALLNELECRFLEGEMYSKFKKMMNKIRFDKRHLLRGYHRSQKTNPNAICVRNKAAWSVILGEYLTRFETENDYLLSKFRSEPFVRFS